MLLRRGGSGQEDGEEADAKSILEVLMLAGSKDSRLQIVAEGRDEAEAVEELRLLIANRFEEEE